MTSEVSQTGAGLACMAEDAAPNRTSPAWQPVATVSLAFTVAIHLVCTLHFM